MESGHLSGGGLRCVLRSIERKLHHHCERRQQHERHAAKSVLPDLLYCRHSLQQQQCSKSGYSPELVVQALTATAGSGGSIAPSGSFFVTQGASQTFTITPSSGYQVATVLVDGALSARSRPTRFNSRPPIPSRQRLQPAPALPATPSPLRQAQTVPSPSGNVAVTSGRTRNLYHHSVFRLQSSQCARMTESGSARSGATRFLMSRPPIPSRQRLQPALPAIPSPLAGSKVPYPFG